MSNKLSEHFSRQEFACHCGCGNADVSAELVGVLEQIRARFGAPVIVTSGRRCETHNRKCGGVPSSQHLQGTAADIHIEGVTPQQIADYVGTILPAGGIGIYPTFTHIDVRKNRARWQGQ